MPRYSNDELYAPCFCGSGKKLKFCCANTAPLPPSESADTVLVERAFSLVEAGMHADARTLLEELATRGTGDARALNSLALLRFTMGDEDEAIELAEKVWTELWPGNAYAGGVLAHGLAAVGRIEEANEVADKLVRVPILADSHGHAVVSALAALGRDADVVMAAKKTPEPKSEVVLFASAVALVNLGRVDEARVALRRAMTAWPNQGAGMRAMLAELERGRIPASPWPRRPLLPTVAWLPGDAGRTHLTGLSSDDQLAGVARRFPIVIEAAKQMALTSEGDRRFTGLTMLARMRTDAARDALLDVAASKWADDETRMHAVMALVQEGLVPQGAPVRVRVEGKVQEVRLEAARRGEGDKRRSNEEREAEVRMRFGVPPEVDEEYGAALADIRAGKLKRALTALERLLRRLPAHPTIRFNIIATRVQIDDDDYRAQRELRALLDEHPDYLFARAQLATFLVSAKRVDEAKAALDMKHLTGGGVVPEWAGMALIALARIAVAEGDVDLAARHVDAARSMGIAVEEFAPDLVLVTSMTSFMGDLRARREAKEIKRQRRVLAMDAPFDEWFANRNVEGLKRILKALGVTNAGPRKTLLFRLKDALSDATTVQRTLDRLSDPARAAWSDLVRSGWSMAIDAFEEQHAPSPQESKKPRRGGRTRKGEEAPAPLEELVERGLVVVGALRGTPSVVVPPVVRGAVSDRAASSAVSWTIGSVVLPPVPDETGALIEPLAILVVADDGAIVGMSMCAGESVGEAIERAVRASVAQPARGAPRGPPVRVTVVDDVARVAVRRALSAATTVVEVGDVSAVDDAAADLLEHLDEAMGPPHTYLGPGVKVADVAAVFDAAEAFHGCAPWDVVPDDGCLFRLRCEQAELDVVACVIGQAGESFGLVLYRSVADYEQWREEFDRDESPSDLPATTSLHLEHREDVPASMLAEIEEHRWKVAREDGVPLIVRTGVGLTPELPSAQDLQQLEIAARVVASIVQRDGRLIQRMRRERSTSIAPADVIASGKSLRVLVDAFAID